MKRILCFGDSNTWGFDPRSPFGDRYPPDVRWTGQLGPRYQILECGQNGRRIPANSSSIHLPQPLDALVVLLGTNDLLSGCTADDTADRMVRFLTSFHRPTTLLIAPPPLRPGAWITSDRQLEESRLLADAYRRLADQLHIAFADAAPWQVETLFDGVHFSPAGHHAFAAGLLPVLDVLLSDPQLSTTP